MFFSVFASLVLFTGEINGLRGVHPDSDNKYNGKVLTCPSPDEPVELSQDKLNDNYCDCPLTGFDEPGTGACSTGKFWCRNIKPLGKFISSIYVDDGHCDCCDGSDESNGVCQNTCKEELKEYNERMEKYQRGLVLKKELVVKAKEDLEGKRTRLIHLEQMLDYEKRMLKQGEEVLLISDISVDDDDESNDGITVERVSKLENIIKEFLETNDDSKLRASYKGYCEEYGLQFTMKKNKQDNRNEIMELVWGKFIWAMKYVETNIYKWISVNETNVQVDVDVEVEEDVDVEEEEEMYDERGKIIVPVSPIPPVLPSASKLAIKSGLSSEDHSNLKKTMAGINERIKAYTKEMTDLNNVLSLDYGVESAWFALYGQCVTGMVGSRTVTACPFDNVTLQEDGKRIKLGKWQGWSNDLLLRIG